MELRRVVKIDRLREKREDRILEKVKVVAKSPLNSEELVIEKSPESQSKQQLKMKLKGSLSLGKESPSESKKSNLSPRVIISEKLERRDSNLMSRSSRVSTSELRQPRDSVMQFTKADAKSTLKYASRKSKWDWGKSQAKVQSLVSMKKEFPNLATFGEFTALKTSQLNRKKQALPVSLAPHPPTLHHKTSLSISGSITSLPVHPNLPKNVSPAELRSFLSQVNPLSPPTHLHTGFLSEILKASELESRVSDFTSAVCPSNKQLASGVPVSVQQLEHTLNRDLPLVYDAAEDLSKLLGVHPEAQGKKLDRLMRAVGLGSLKPREWEWVRSVLDFDGDGVVDAKDIARVWNALIH